MSKSYKKNPVKKIKGLDKDNYWRRVRGTTKNILKRKNIEELEEVPLPNPKEIVNDCDYTDQWWICEDKCKCVKDYGYKKCLNK